MLTFGMKTPLKKRQTGSDLVMRKFILLLSVLLILTSCSLSKDSNKPEEVPDEDNEEESIIPNYKVSEDQYQIMLPYQPSEARGTITNQISNRFDIDEMEEGLRRHSVSAYDLDILTRCSLSKDSNKPEEVPDEDNEEESIIPNYKVSEDQYQIMLPYQPSEARGTITNQISNRFDIDEMEEGLRRHSVSAYDPDDY